MTARLLTLLDLTKEYVASPSPADDADDGGGAPAAVQHERVPNPADDAPDD